MSGVRELEFEDLQLLDRQVSAELDVTHKWMQDKNGRKTELFKLSVALFTAMVAAFASASKFSTSNSSDDAIAFAVLIASLGYGALNIAIAKLYIDDHVAVVLAMAQVNLLRQAADCVLYTLVNKQWPEETPSALRLDTDPYWTLFGKRRAAPIDNTHLRNQVFWITGDAFALTTMLLLAIDALFVSFLWFRKVLNAETKANAVLVTMFLTAVAEVIIASITLRGMKLRLHDSDKSEGHSPADERLIALVRKLRNSK